MKNKLKQELERELQRVRISSELKKRILTEATASRMPEKRKRVSAMPLAAAAAVVLMFGLAAGIAMLRTEKPDLSAAPLSAAKVRASEEMVWVQLPEGLYHALSDCPEVEDPVSMKLDTARASGLKGCSNCIGADHPIARDLVWMTVYGDYYHSMKDCSGMTGAVGVLEIEAKMLGRKPCQICAAEGEIFYDPEIAATLVPSMIPVLLDGGAEEKYAAGPTCTPWPDPTAAPTTTPELEERPMPTPVATVEPTPMPTAAPTEWMPTEMPTEAPAEWMPTAMPTVAPVDSEEFVASSVAVVMNEEGNASFWMTKNGVYYHVAEHCSGMEGAHVCTEEEAVKAGKILCMVCMPEEVSSEESRTGGFDGPSAIFVTEQRSVWMTDGGVYYHSDEHCSGMEGAYASDESAATENGKFPCPVCLADSYAEEVQFVWMTQDGAYYHTDEHCSGMEDAYGCEVLEALANGKAPCPKCAEQLSSVWATENGMYYHLNPDCSGMTGAKEIPGRDAVMQGKTLCPSCRREIAEAAVETAKRYGY